MGKPNININVGAPSKGEQTYKTIILKPNLPFAIQTIDEDTTYVIKWNFDLSGEEVTIPANCVLKFEGGSLNNGGIVLNGCSVFPTFDAIVGDNIELAGLPKIGTQKWDADLGKPLWCNGEDWVDAMGNVIEPEQDVEENTDDNN